ncbi:MAG TPA: amidotransferase [Desulfocapsa sulfexigens]|nr:amidotransferase [Desulfocapsa sulfexigens]
MAAIHWIQHVSFEGLGYIEKYLIDQGHDLFCSRLWAGDTLPPPDSFTALIVMGGPMGIYDDEEHPWLQVEKEFLAQVVDLGTPILGICLGAQLLADVLGAEVSANPAKEIGWFPVTRNDAVPDFLEPVLPEEMTVFHWHGDTFGIPENAVSLYSSEACVHQAFLYKEHVLGLQFHLETTRESATALIDNCRNELVQDSWIMTGQEMLSSEDSFNKINDCMSALLETFFPLKG